MYFKSKKRVRRRRKIIKVSFVLNFILVFKKKKLFKVTKSKKINEAIIKKTLFIVFKFK